MEQLTKNQAVATSQEAVQNQNETQLREENAHNDKSVHGVLNPTYQAGLRRDAVRSEERRVGKECRSRYPAQQQKREDQDSMEARRDAYERGGKRGKLEQGKSSHTLQRARR